MVRASSSPDPQARRRWVLGALVGLLLFEVVRCAWLCDDAYITFRTVDNLVHGLGARWNPAERVQVYTHPLWMLLLAGASLPAPSIYATGIGLGVLTTLAAALILVRRAPASDAGKAVALVVLVCSKAFVDFSTSGLENPLVHLLLFATLIAAVCVEDRARNALWVALGTALLAVTRLDLVLLAGPVLVGSLVRAGRAAPRAALLGLAPLVVWELFSLLYYGFPLPNTAYAKLGSGLPAAALAGQGAAYLAESLRADPVTLIAILGGTAAAFVSRDRTGRLAAVGVLLYLGYVVEIGGDFMSGRFLTPPLAAAAFLLARVSWKPRAALAAAAVLVVAELVNQRSPLRAPTAYGFGAASPHEHIDDRGIADERAYWFAYTGLFSPDRGDPEKHHVTRGHPFAERLRAEGPQVRVANGMGFMGYFAGPEVHLLDPMGLADPLCARLPIYRRGALLAPEENAFRGRPWRIGHFYRAVPDGYLEALRDPGRPLADPGLTEYVHDLELLTRAPLFDGERLRTLVSMNLGRERHLVEAYLERADAGPRREAPGGDE